MIAGDAAEVVPAPTDVGSRRLRLGLLASYVGVLGSLVVVTLLVGVEAGVVSTLLCLLAQWAVALVWIHRAWTRLPVGERRSSTGAEVTPGTAVGFLFVPLFNLYWIYVTNLGLANAWNRVHENAYGVRPISVGLAKSAVLLQFVPYLNFLVAPAVWFAFMRSVDRAADTATESLDVRTLAERFS